MMIKKGCAVISLSYFEGRKYLSLIWKGKEEENKIKGMKKKKTQIKKMVIYKLLKI